MRALQGSVSLNQRTGIRQLLLTHMQDSLFLILVALASFQFVANAAFPIQFAPPINFSPGQSPLCAGDFNGDGFPDLAIGYTNRTVAILTNDRTGTLRLLTNFSVPNDLRAFATGDFNGDNKLDLVAVGGYATIFLNNGNSTFTRTNLPGYLNATAVAVGDFNRDRRSDVATVG